MDLSDGFIDIHCHLLPGLDDGASCWQQSLDMAKIALSESIQGMIVTPHQLGSYRQNSGQIIRELTQEFQQKLEAANLPLRVYPGADVRIDDTMMEGLRSGDVLTLGDHGQHVLLELPHELYFPLEPVLDSLAELGMTGILSHPERNHGLLGDRGPIQTLVEKGCLMQITAGSLSGSFGPRCQQMAEWMLGNPSIGIAAVG